MSDLPGTWDVDLATPIGTLHVQYRFTATTTGFEGTATGAKETVPLSNIVVADTGGGERVTWHQRVTSPLRLNLGFDVVVNGDTLTGHSRAGRLPRTRVTGRRVAS